MNPMPEAHLAGELTIRPYAPADWPAICRIHDAARVQELAAGGVDRRAFRPMTEAAIADGFFDSETVVAQLGERVEGFVAWNGAYVSWLYVNPSAQRHGIGRRLLVHALQKIGRQAWTNMLVGNNRALTLYRQVGFEVVWERNSLCDGFPCVAMRLALPTSRMRDPSVRREPRTT